MRSADILHSNLQCDWWFLCHLLRLTSFQTGTVCFVMILHIPNAVWTLHSLHKKKSTCYLFVAKLMQYYLYIPKYKYHWLVVQSCNIIYISKNTNIIGLWFSHAILFICPKILILLACGSVSHSCSVMFKQAYNILDAICFGVANWVMDMLITTPGVTFQGKYVHKVWWYGKWYFYCFDSVVWQCIISVVVMA